MQDYTGCKPSDFIKELAEEQERLKTATIKSKNRPEFSRKPSQISPMELDYGENAVEVASRTINLDLEKPNVMQKYIVGIKFIKGECTSFGHFLYKSYCKNADVLRYVISVPCLISADKNKLSYTNKVSILYFGI